MKILRMELKMNLGLCIVKTEKGCLELKNMV